MIKCDGNYKWLWEMIDNETKFMVATHLSRDRTIKEALSIFKQAKERASEKPDKIMLMVYGLMKKLSRKHFTADIKKIK